MSAPTLEDLARQAAAGDRGASEEVCARLQAVFRLLDPVTLDRVTQSAAAVATGLSRPLPPELLEWARQDLNEAEFAADFREVREKGGVTLAAMLPESERLVEGP